MMNNSFDERDDQVPEMAAMPPRNQGLTKQSSVQTVTMEYFLESRNLDVETADMLQKYDKDGNGSFSKDEVVSILLDLRQQRDQNHALKVANALFRKMLIGAVIMCILLFAGMFGLSFAVAALTAKTDVSSNGHLVSTTDSSFVATDNAANSYEVGRDAVDGIYCIPQSEGELLIEQVMDGRNVLIQLDEFDENGHAFVDQLTANGADIDPSTGTVCFPAPEMGEGKKICLKPSDGKCSAALRRRLKGCEGDDCEEAETEGMVLET